MKKKILFSIIVAASLFAGNITISKGWNLVGAPNTIKQTEFTGNNCIKAVWKYDSLKENGPWFLYDRDGLGSNYPKITEGISKGEGFWVLSDCANDSNISYIDSNITALQKTLVGTAIASGNKMAIVAKVGGRGAGTVSTAISNSTKDLGRVLYREPTRPAYNIDENGRLIEEINVTEASNTAILKITFSLNGQDINASYVTDNTGKAYGLDDESGLPKVGPDLGAFFYKLLNNNATQSDFVTIITEVNNLKSRPLFSIVGDDAFQSFFSSFPYDQTSAQNANWAQLGQKFVDLNLSEDNPPEINFSKINFDINMSLKSGFTMGNMTLTLPTMIANGTLDTLLNPDGIEVIFKSGNKIGSLSIPDAGIDGNISNIEMDSALQTDGSIGVYGKYDLAIPSNDGHTYTVISDFETNGIKAAMIFDDKGHLVNQVEMFDDGLWIVDEDENKIKKVDQTIIPSN